MYCTTCTAQDVRHHPHPTTCTTCAAQDVRHHPHCATCTASKELLRMFCLTYALLHHTQRHMNCTHAKHRTQCADILHERTTPHQEKFLEACRGLHWLPRMYCSHVLPRMYCTHMCCPNAPGEVLGRVRGVAHPGVRPRRDDAAVCEVGEAQTKHDGGRRVAVEWRGDCTESASSDSNNNNNNNIITNSRFIQLMRRASEPG